MNILIFLALIFSWIVPDHFPPWTSFHAEVPAFVASILGLVACWRWNKGVVQLPKVIAIFAVLMLIGVVQWGSGLVPYSGDILLVAVYLFTFGSAWLWGYHWCKRANLDQLQVGICIFVVFVGLVTAWQVLAQWLRVEQVFQGWVLHGLPGDARPRANLGQPNQAATILLMANTAVAILHVKERVRNEILWSAASLLGMALVLTRSRTSLMSSLLLAGLYVWIWYRNKAISLKPRAVLIWLVLLFFASWALPLINGASTVIGNDHYQMAAVGTRPLIWKQLTSALLESPWVGFGWLQVATAQQVGALEYPGTEQTIYSHNILLDSLIYLGVPCASLLLIVSAVWAWRRLRFLFQSEKKLPVLLLLIPFLVHSLLEFPHAYAYFLVLVGLLLGLFDRVTEGTGVLVFFTRRKIFLTVIVLWSTLLLATGYEYALVEEDFRINRFENRKLGTTPPDYVPPRIFLLTQLSEVLQAMRLRATPHMASADVDLLVRVSNRYSWAQMHFRTALALGLNNRHAEATLQLRVIKALFAEDIYVEAKENYLRLQVEKYPELAQVVIP